MRLESPENGNVWVPAGRLKSPDDGEVYRHLDLQLGDGTPDNGDASIDI